MASSVRDRFRCPEWKQDATIPLDLDYRCFVEASRHSGRYLVCWARLAQESSMKLYLALTGASPRQNAVSMPLRVARAVSDNISRNCSGDIALGSLLVELAPSCVRPKMVVGLAPRPFRAGSVHYALPQLEASCFYCGS